MPAVLPSVAMAGYAHLRRRADGMHHERDHLGALLLYRQLMQLHPHDHAVRLHVGDALSQLGLTHRAAQVYAAVALSHLRGGRPLQGVAACCALLSVSPGAGDVVPTMAQMYGRGSSRVDRALRPTPPPAPPMGGDETADPAIPVAELLHSVVALAAKADAVQEGDEQGPLPPLPILSDLDQADLGAVLAGVRRRRYKAGEALMRQGEPGDAFYLIAHGGVRVLREDDGQTHALATLGPGSVLGEMALVTQAPRGATVRALGDVDSIEIPVAALAQVAGDSAAVAAALDRFTRDRLLHNVLSSSRLFRPFWPDHVSRLMPLFEARDFREGAVLIEEGAAGPGLFVVLSGSCSVRRGEGADDTVEVGQVGPGDVLGEMALLGDGEAKATVVATAPTMTLLLPREPFEELMGEQPAVRAELEALGEARETVNAFVLEDQFEDADGSGEPFIDEEGEFYW